MGTKGETYADIKLGSKDGGVMGSLKFRPDGIVWESQVLQRHPEASPSLAARFGARMLRCTPGAGVGPHSLGFRV